MAYELHTGSERAAHRRHNPALNDRGEHGAIHAYCTRFVPDGMRDTDRRASRERRTTVEAQLYRLRYG